MERDEQLNEQQLVEILREDLLLDLRASRQIVESLVGNSILKNWHQERIKYLEDLLWPRER